MSECRKRKTPPVPWRSSTAGRIVSPGNWLLLLVRGCSLGISSGDCGGRGLQQGGAFLFSALDLTHGGGALFCSALTHGGSAIPGTYYFVMHSWLWRRMYHFLIDALEGLAPYYFLRCSHT